MHTCVSVYVYVCVGGRAKGGGIEGGGGGGARRGAGGRERMWMMKTDHPTWLASPSLHLVHDFWFSTDSPPQKRNHLI